MSCEVVKFPGGAAIVRAAPMRARACSACRRKTTTYRLCDFPVAGYQRKTCDAVLCEACTVHPGGDKERDYCPLHAAYSEGRLKL